MNYWLICLPRTDLQHCIEIGVFGLSRKQTIEKVRAGDKIVCCAGKGDWKVIAFGEVTSDYYIDDKHIFLKAGSYIDRFQFEAHKLPVELDLIAVLGELTFVTKIEYWQLYFRNAIAKLSEGDWDLFQALSAASATSSIQK